MYSIIQGGSVIAMCEKPRFVRLNEQSGAYIEAEEKAAEAIAVAGMLYNLPGKNFIKDAPEVIVKNEDVSEIVFENSVKIEKNAEETNSAFISVENAVCELDTATDNRITEVENALCELDDIINGGEV